MLKLRWLTTSVPCGALAVALSSSAAGLFAFSITTSAIAQSAAGDAAAADADDSEEITEEQKEEAAARYREGVSAYKKERYKDAVDFFLEADALVPSAALSFNIARAYEKLGDDANALRWYRDYLRREPEAEDKEAVGELIDKFEKRLEDKGVQQITVLSRPRGATVVIDEQPVGVTPWTGELAPGKHRVALQRRGYADTERSVELPADDAIDVEIRLVPAADKPPPPPPSTVGATPTNARKDATRDEAEPTGIQPLTWITLGAGVATLGGAGTFEFLRRQAESDAEDAPTQLEYSDALDRVDSHTTMARVLLGVGGALTLAGGVLLYLDLSRSSSSETAVRTSPMVTGGCLSEGCWVGARGTF